MEYPIHFYICWMNCSNANNASNFVDQCTGSIKTGQCDKHLHHIKYMYMSMSDMPLLPLL